MTKKTKKPILKFGIIGVGHMGQYHLNVVASLPTHKLVGIYDANKERGQELADKFETRYYSSAEKLFKDVSAVTIAAPTHLHYDIAKSALEHDCHVLVEKPITQTLEQAMALAELAQKKGKILQVGHVERFNGAVMELHKIVREPKLIQTRRLAPYNTRIADVGVILDLLIHDLDIVLNLVKSPLKGFQAYGNKVVSAHEDIAVINLQFENGCIATLTGSRVSQYKERSLSVTLDKSYLYLNYGNQDIEIHRQGSSAYLMTPEEIKYSQESFVERLYIHKDNPLKSEHEHFYSCITENTTPFVPNEKDIETLKIALGSIEMIRNSGFA